MVENIGRKQSPHCVIGKIWLVLELHTAIITSITSATFCQKIIRKCRMWEQEKRNVSSFFYYFYTKYLNFNIFAYTTVTI